MLDKLVQQVLKYGQFTVTYSCCEMQPEGLLQSFLGGISGLSKYQSHRPPSNWKGKACVKVKAKQSDQDRRNAVGM